MRLSLYFPPVFDGDGGMYVCMCTCACMCLCMELMEIRGQSWVLFLMPVIKLFEKVFLPWPGTHH